MILANMVDLDGKEYLIVEVRGRLRHSKLLSEVIDRGDLLLADIGTGNLFIKKRSDFTKNNLFIHRHRGDKFLRIPIDRAEAYAALVSEIEQGFMTSYLVRCSPKSVKIRVFAAEILKNTTKVKQQIRGMIHGVEF